MALPTSTNNVTVRKLASAMDSYNTKVNTKLSGKADKVSGATSGHLASLDGNGNLADSGKSASDFVAKTAGVTNVAWDSTNKKITKTINGSSSEVVTASTLKTAMALNNVTNDAQVKRSEMGVANGVATLDSTGKIPTSQIPAAMDDVKEGYLYDGKFYYDTEHTQEITASADMVYVDKSTNKTYRWSGTQYVVIGTDLALGETSSTAYRGDRGKAAYDHSQLTSGNPHNVTKSDVGLGSVVNTGDSATPVSGGTTKFTTGGAYTELAKKENVSNKVKSTSGWSSTTSDDKYPSEKLVKSSLDDKVDKVSGKGLSTNDYTTAEKNKLAGISSGATKTAQSSFNGSILIDGNDVDVYVHPEYTQTAASAKKIGCDALGHVVFGDALAKGDVGLGNVDNTSDATKKSNFTGAVENNNTGFPTGGAVYTAINNAKSSVTPQSRGFGYSATSTLSGTTFAVTLADYVLTKNGFVSVKFGAAVPASASLNINGKGAKAIYYAGAAITADTIQQGDTGTFVYDGTNYVLIAIDRSAKEMTSTEVTDLIAALT